jgi:hypothetical protein
MKTVIDTVHEACVTEILNFKATVIGALLKFFFNDTANTEIYTIYSVDLYHTIVLYIKWEVFAVSLYFRSVVRIPCVSVIGYTCY